MDKKCVFGIFDMPAKNEARNTLTRSAFEKYLSGPIWNWQKLNKKIVGGVTHLQRNDAGSEDGLGSSDKLLKEGVITHCIKDLWISEDGKRLEGIMEIFDDLELYSDAQKGEILQVLRLIKNGVSLGLSLVITGDWDDYDGHLKEVIKIEGLDFTLDPSFSYTETK